jgi:hypothetical protein
MSWVWGICALLLASGASANGVFESITGDVRAAAGKSAPVPVSQAQLFQPGTSVTTGPNSQAILRFEDGQVVVLHENTEFRVNAYRFDLEKPQSDSIALQIVKGAMRSATGLIGRRSGNSVLVTMPQASIGIRGTDFMVAVVNPAYFLVIDGAIVVANTAGKVTFGAGALGTVAGVKTLATGVTVDSLPPSVSAAFNAMRRVAVGAAAGPAGFGGASAGATGTGAAASDAPSAAATVIAVGIAVLAAAAANRSASNH